MCEGSSFGAGSRKPVTSVKIIEARNASVHQPGLRPLDMARMTQPPVPMAIRLGWSERQLVPSRTC